MPSIRHEENTVADKPSFYITTPIYYVNAAPHLGTAYCTMLCDVQARYRRAAGYDVKFLTGMDEHGEKVAEAAAAHGFDTPQAWCDSQAPLFQDLWRELEISNDDFIRTTEPRQ
ncbi:MAG: methionine--tRNA ligase, partial [Coriobacteriia bacterium]